MSTDLTEPPDEAIRRLRASNASLRAEVTRLTALVETLRDALRPFLVGLGDYHPNWFTGEWDNHQRMVQVTIGDLRRAQAVTETTANQGPCATAIHCAPDT